VLELQLDAKDPAEFLEFLKLDLYQDEIFVFTPTGDVIQLPKGATPIDFAFAVHTEVGQHCAGAKVNGKIAPLSRQLRNSETVEILTSPNAKPSRDWLAHVRTGARATRSVSGCGTRRTSPRSGWAARSSSARCASAGTRSWTTPRSSAGRARST
jgi:GTP pyrophosphokinase